MTVGVLTIEIRIPSSGSLKEKRMVLNRIKDRTRKKFNVSVAETAYNDKWQRAELAFALVSGQHGYVEEVLNKLFAQLDADDLYEIIRYEVEYK
ncbi:MAG TPA: DUF503 domain-containing protein [Caldithrix abyssi]|uniref:DUF503 domain-containing protein n=1 Tax=Caldithrix abyssi TaxID=187145 RepID=A0A7V4WTP8_CALAY|nr:DUF503 domain-containing protein [Caldithrix abyssi]